MLCNHFKVEKTECSSSVRCLYYTTCDVSKEKNPNYVFDPEGRSIKSFETLINIKQSRLGDIPHDRNSGSTTVTIVHLALLQLRNLCSLLHVKKIPCFVLSYWNSEIRY